MIEPPRSTVAGPMTGSPAASITSEWGTPGTPTRSAGSKGGGALGGASGVLAHALMKLATAAIKAPVATQRNPRPCILVRPPRPWTTRSFRAAHSTPVRCQGDERTTRRSVGSGSAKIAAGNLE
jgi:hypothetical protein